MNEYWNTGKTFGVVASECIRGHSKSVAIGKVSVAFCELQSWHIERHKELRSQFDTAMQVIEENGLMGRFEEKGDE
jgi:hypothetical protein